VLEKWAEASGRGFAPETGLSVGKGVVSWCLLTSQGTTTNNRFKKFNCSSHRSTWRGQHSDVFTPYIVELKNVTQMSKFDEQQ